MTRKDYDKELTDIHQRTKLLFDALDIDTINWKPAPDRWSMAQCLDHLIHTGKEYERELRNLIEHPGAKTIWMRIPFWSDLWGKMLVKTVHPDNRKKVKTFPIFRPTNSDLPEEILEDYLNHLADAKGLIGQLFDRQLLQKKVSSPVNNVFCFRVEEILMILILHNVRHLNQAEEVLELFQSQRSGREDK